MVAASVVVSLVAVLGLTGYLLRPQPGVRPVGFTGPALVARADALPSSAPTTSSTQGVRVDPTWVRRTAAASRLPQVAVDAYGRAALTVAEQDTGCHLGWTTLAGVGTVESANGTIGGRRLRADGTSDRPITGPALNGVGGFAAIESGREWVRALGPMQFLPSSWQRWGVDGDGDGRPDVHDIYDAALAAARYLCADGHDLATAQGWTAAIYSYNHSSTYVRSVYDAAAAAARS